MSTSRARRDPLLKQVRVSLQAFPFLKAGSVVLVGISGGPDSVCLLHLLTRLAPNLGLRLWAAHLDHGLRGAEGAADAAFVQRICDQWDVPCTIERRDVASYRRAHREISSLEEAARLVRYAFFTEVARQVGAAAVAVGHTADDQVETVLLHLVRGAGLPGLGGMAAESVWRDQESARAVRIVRPLLQVSRQQTQAYCQRHQLETRTDAMNLSPRFTRNRVRQEVLPRLRALNPRVDRAILQLSKLAQQEEAAWQDQVARVWPKVASVGPQGVRLEVAKILLLPAPLQQRLLRRAYAEIAKTTRELGYTHIDGVLRLLHAGTGKSRVLSNLVEAVVLYGGLFFRKAATDVTSAPPAAPAVLQVPGETAWGGWKAQAHLHPGPALPTTLEPWCAHLDYQQTGPRIIIRSRRPGDRFQPLGLKQRKKLQDFLVDARVLRRLRNLIPLLEVDQEIAWVGGQRVSDRCKVTPDTHTTLVVELTPTEPYLKSLLQSCDKAHYNTPAPS